MGLPGIGKTNAVHWIRNHILKDYKSKILLAQLDLNDLISLNDLEFYRLLLLELYQAISEQLPKKQLKTFTYDKYHEAISCNDTLLTFNAIKQILAKLLAEIDLKVVFLLDDFDEKLKSLNKSVFNGITALRALHKTRIIYLFVSGQDLEAIFPPDKIGELYNLIHYNKHWLYPLNKEENFKLTDEFADILETKISTKAKERIWELSGGHAWYTKTLTKIIIEKEEEYDCPLEELSENSTIRSRGKQILVSLPPKYKGIIKRISLGEKVAKSEIPEFLIKTETIKFEGDKPKFFSPLFESYVKSLVLKKSASTLSNHSQYEGSKHGLSIDIKHRVILKDKKPLKTTFTKGEFNLLKYFFRNESLAISREEVAEVIWGKNANQKYSDWAIDKIISRTREKIEDDSRKPKHLLTLRGVGFKFISES